MALRLFGAAAMLVLFLPATALPEDEPSPENAAKLARAEELDGRVVEFYKAGKYAEAEALARESLKLREEALGSDHPDVATSLNNLATLLEAQGRYDAARPLHERALAVVEASLRRGLAGLQGAERLRQIEASRFVLDNWLRAAPRCGRTGCEEVLRIRGLVTRAEAAERALLRAGGETAEARMEDILALDRQLGGLSVKVPREADQKEAWRKRCGELAKKREELLLALARDHEPLRDARARLDLGLEEIRARLGEGEALVGYLRTGDGYLAYVILGKSDVVRVDPPRGIDEAAEEFVTAVASGSEASGSRLASLILAPVREKLPAGLRRLYLCPDAALAAVPFGVLPGTKPRTFLLDEVEIVHLEMAQDLVPLVSPPEPGRGALVVGGVDYGKASVLPSPAPSPFPVRVDRAPAEAGRWEALPATEKEADLLRAREGSATLSGAAATEARFRALCRKRAILHLATHGYVRTDRLAKTLKLLEEARKFEAGTERQLAVGTDPMLLAGIVLAGANTGDGGEGDDGLLTAAEASWLDLDGVRLAVLSACETGRGTPVAGEGTLGLVRGFRLAGAGTVVASLWKVEDEATALLMGTFYEGLLERKLEPAAALREAARAVRGFADKEGGRPFAKPRFWGAFVTYGR